MYNEQDLVRIAKRENNTKRTYLVANQFQGKYLAFSGTRDVSGACRYCKRSI